LFEVQAISAQYGKVKILHQVSLKVERGQIVSLVGANGAGKTTLMNVISGLIPPSSGSVFFEGFDLAEIPNHRIVEKGIAQIPEGRKLFYKMSVLENLLTGATHKAAKKRMKETLAEVLRIFPILQERRQQSAQTLSGGEQQMLAIARGLMSCPRLILMDEPSLGLAPIMVKKIFEVVRQLNEQKLSILLVEQNLRASLKISHYGYVMENGRIALEGKGQDLLTNEHTKKAYIGLL
jgi:branched-chain amino acid transport system ATP-binding protein